MRKVVVYELLSVDGVAEAPETFFGWADDLDPQLARTIGSQDAVILGRTTFDEWSQYWPGPGAESQPFAPFINSVAKHIATSTPLDREWRNARKIEGSLVDHVRMLKEQPGGDIGVHGSIKVAQSLLEAGVVDELKLVVGPMVASQGRRLLDGMPPGMLELAHSEVSPSGYLVLDYRVTGKPVEPFPEDSGQTA
ncbi:MAG TPA: dihydrofolate reductase family protein [Candidatus Limnocylindrales bacterium]|nr:dihydrofolate reductase family protein [Candidatus Limnocylindrales bacterium]